MSRPEGEPAGDGPAGEEHGSLRADDPRNDSEHAPLALEVAWPLAVAAGAVGSFLGLLLAWPAFPAAFATVALWVVQRRARIGDRPGVATLLVLAWLAAIVLSVGTWAAHASPVELERPFPGTHLLHELAAGRPWLPLLGAAVLGTLGVVGARWAEGLFAPWSWALVAGFAAAFAGERSSALLGDGAEEASAVLGALPAGALAALAAAVLLAGWRASGDRRFAWASGAAFAAGCVLAALGRG